MAYDASKPFSYGIPDGTYHGRPITASFFEKDGVLILDVKFAVRDPSTGEFYKKENGYDWEAQKRHWITNKDGGFNEATINGIREWAKGWNCTDIGSFYWFQQPDESGNAFGNLAAIGDVKLQFQTGQRGQNLWVHDINANGGSGRKAFVPDGANSDQAAIMAKWGAKAKAVFASVPRKMPAAAQNAPSAPSAASAAPAPATAPSRPPSAPAPVSAPVAAPAPANGWDSYPQTADGAFAYYCSLLGEKYSSAKHDERWFDIYEAACPGKDPDQLDAVTVRNLFAKVRSEMQG